MKKLLAILLLCAPLGADAGVLINSYRFGSFTPPDISGLWLWLGHGTLTGANDDPYATWTDSSGNGRNAVQATAGLKPLLKTAVLNGNNALLSDGNDRMTVAASLARPHTVFLVYKSVANTGRTLSSDGIGAGTYNWLLGSHSSGARWWYASSQVGAAGESPGTWYILSAVANTGGSEYWSNGASVASSAATGVWGADLNLFATNKALDGGGGTPDEFATAYIAEVIVYDSALGTTDRQRVEDYISAWSGIAVTH